jgi:hypothetical protein
MNQILRPMAVPAAGGVFLSLVFFGLLAPNFVVHANTKNDVPVPMYPSPTQVSILNPSPFGFNGQDITVEVTVDKNGAVSDYKVQGGEKSKDELKDVANFILFTTFKAATVFGQPVSSKLLLNINHIDVRS